MSGPLEHDSAIFFASGIGLENRLHRDRFFHEQSADFGQPYVAFAVVHENGILQEGFHHAVDIESGVCLDKVGDRFG
ncbi:hypothetical protein [Pseudomonas bharatica]|uniref:hypothetical protein n=1 Tax=Pseudomonas bharatica TaxID=2692112 RepID=UPI00147F146F|nr:hypothetical protein [Pseudomonas bharatica]